MKARLKITGFMLDMIREDLERPHAFAYERVGFLTCGATVTPHGELILLVRDYQPVADEDYQHDPTVGANIGAAAIRKGLQRAYRPPAALIHVHSHGGIGRPEFSGVDLDSAGELVPSFFNAVPRMPHGVVVFSHDSARGLLWPAADQQPTYVEGFVRVGGGYKRFGGPNDVA
jgi:hypothetical protein